MTLEELAASNSERLNALAKKGVILDTSALLKMRVDFLTAFVFKALDLLSPNSIDPLREAFDLNWEQQISEIADEAESQLARKILLDGVN